MKYLSEQIRPTVCYSAFFTLYFDRLKPPPRSFIYSCSSKSVESGVVKDGGQIEAVKQVVVKCEPFTRPEATVDGKVHVREMMAMKRISILPLISSFVVCAVFTALSVIQFQMQKMTVSVTNLEVHFAAWRRYCGTWSPFSQLL
ncbi:hypothetical protein D915_007605 [Fasciola hepatica]|uniref:Uncharacterized protein n=1 Tax=Fasciola hepatica TaxID=6192 RepID=A0A4E0R7G5_FASHE|nr:hypothetical protein D915_007605 [Fasciola hepatica]